MNTLILGAVSYLNTKPLVYGLEERSDEVDLRFDLPSRLADRLENGELDVALIPVIEAVSNPGYTIVSDACIACHGPVWSVKLFSRVPAGDIRTLSLDEGSRTSAALARVILHRQFAVNPNTEILPIDQPWRDSKSDAVLVIGDRAMNIRTDSGLAGLAEFHHAKGFRYEWDLGEHWNRWTELPFVFAVWAARPGVDVLAANQLLTAARDAGQENIQRICQAAAIQYDIDIGDCHRYLTRHLHFHLGQREKMGLDLFLDYARQQSIIRDDLKLQFHDCQTTG